MQQALGMIETRGLIALVEATDAMLKSANVEVIGPMTQVGNAMVTVCVTGDVAAVKAATEAGRNAAQSLGEVLGTSVIARPHNELTAILPKAK
jgi:ethanolamine utilization protein EutM